MSNCPHGMIGCMCQDPMDGPKAHNHEYEWTNCGAQVCAICDDHKGLARCFCGWSRDGGDGRQQLIDMGERIDEDDP